jgi:type VI secretion system protein ImpG
VRVRLSEEHFGGEGEIFLFGSIINELLANSVSINSFSRLQVIGSRFSEVFAWPARIGRRSIL